MAHYCPGGCHCLTPVSVLIASAQFKLSLHSFSWMYVEDIRKSAQKGAYYCVSCFHFMHDKSTKIQAKWMLLFCVWLCSCDMFLLCNWSLNPSCGWLTVWEPLKLVNEDHFYLTAFRMSSHSLWCFVLYFLFPADASSSCSLESIIWSSKILLMTKSWEHLTYSYISLLEVKSDVCITEFCDLGFII